ncbi:MAG: hypothetical protein ACREJ2_08405, partial [Planctomycetota bacterium]
DDAVVRETLKQIRVQAEAKEAAVTTERVDVRTEIKRLQTEITHAAEAVALVEGRNGSSPSIDRLAQLQEQLQSAERRLTQLTDQLATLGGQIRGEAEMAATLRKFEPVWDLLATREKERVIRLLVEKVAFDGAKGKVAVTFRPNGLVALAQQINQKEA